MYSMAFAAGWEVILQVSLIFVALGCLVFVAVVLTGFFVSLVERGDQGGRHDRKDR